MIIKVKKITSGLLVIVGSLLCCYGTLKFVPTVMSIGHVKQSVIEKDLIISVAFFVIGICINCSAIGAVSRKKALLVSSILPMATIIVLFGFIVFGSFNSADMKGYIPYLIVGSMACMGLSVLLVKMLK